MARHCMVMVRIHVAWWLPLYLQSAALFAYLTDMEPDTERIERWVAKALTAEIMEVEQVELVA